MLSLKLNRTTYPSSIDPNLAISPAYPPRYFRDLPAAEIEARYSLALKAIKASGHHKLEDHLYRTVGGREATLRLRGTR
jgi:hypothetical protein